MTTSRRTIVRNHMDERYLLTSRRLVELDSYTATEENTPWFTTSKEIRKAAAKLPNSTIYVFSKHSSDNSRLLTVKVGFGKSSIVDRWTVQGLYRIGCAWFDFTTFKKILRAAGVKGTQKKAFAAKAGA